MEANNPRSKVLKALFHGPNSMAKRMKAFTINGYRFHTEGRDKSKTTQNYGVMVEAEGKPYYGKITDIIELDYFSECKVVLFRCDWVDVNSSRGRKEDKRGFTLLNFAHKIPRGNALKDDPYILSSQASQVFYVEDEKDKGWSHVVKVKPRDSYHMGATMEDDDDELHPLSKPSNIAKEDEFSDPVNWAAISEE